MSNVTTNDHEIDRPEHPDEQVPARLLALTCPAWCAISDDGHQWDVGRDRWPLRDHEARFDAGEVGVSLGAEERLSPEGLTLSEPRVMISPASHDSDSITIDQARLVVESLTAVLAAVDERAPAPVPNWWAHEYAKGDAGRRYQAIVDRDKRVKLGAPATIPPCPSWCRSAPGHDYPSVGEDEVTFIRHHETQSTEQTAITQEERNVGGVVTLSPPVITVYADGEVTGAKARSRAAELLAMADELDGLLRAV